MSYKSEITGRFDMSGTIINRTFKFFYESMSLANLKAIASNVGKSKHFFKKEKIGKKALALRRLPVSLSLHFNEVNRSQKEKFRTLLINAKTNL